MEYNRLHCHCWLGSSIQTESASCQRRYHYISNAQPELNQGESGIAWSYYYFSYWTYNVFNECYGRMHKFMSNLKQTETGCIETPPIAYTDKCCTTFTSPPKNDLGVTTTVWTSRHGRGGSKEGMESFPLCPPRQTLKTIYFWLGPRLCDLCIVTF